MPQVGLQRDWALSRRLALKFYERLVYVNFSGVRGSIGEGAIHLQWYFTPHVGIAGGFDKESIDLKEYTSGDTTARFRYEVQGVPFFLNLAL